MQVCEIVFDSVAGHFQTHVFRRSLIWSLGINTSEAFPHDRRRFCPGISLILLFEGIDMMILMGTLLEVL